MMCGQPVLPAAVKGPKQLCTSEVSSGTGKGLVVSQDGPGIFLQGLDTYNKHGLRLPSELCHSAFLHCAALPRKKRKEKTMPVGLSSMISQVSYRTVQAAQSSIFAKSCPAKLCLMLEWQALVL